MASIRSRLIKQLVKHRIGRTLRAEVPVEQQRKELEQLSLISVVSPTTKIREVLAPNCPAEWVTHRNARSSHAILFLHGGGFNTGSPKTHRLLTERLSALCEAVVLVPDYRLAPEHPFPAAVNDTTAAYNWLVGRGFKEENIALVGDSAGGGLVMSTLLKLQQNNRRLPSAAVCISPWVDLTMQGESLVKNEKHDIMLNREWMSLMASQYAQDKLADPLCSPLFAELKDLPPIMIQVSDNEILLDDAQALSEAIKKNGGEVVLEVWRKMWHVWPLFVRWMPEANIAAEHAASFITRYWKN
ncbi:MAG: alpha/beta hydrolase [Pseudomonadales bacterium]|nr:alpha/beta hydrolase [Pseudomonadales bacterium]